MKLRIFLSLSLLGMIGALIWVSRPEGPAPTDEELKRELVAERLLPLAPRAPVKLAEGELARAFRVVSARPAAIVAPAPAARLAMARQVFPDDSIPGSQFVRQLEGKPEPEAARAVGARLRELTAADALERVVLREYVRDHVHTPELARELAIQELRADNARNLPVESAWQVDYLASYMNIYLDAGKNDDATLSPALDAVAGQTDPEARLAMAQALLARPHDGSVSVQEALAARGVTLPEAAPRGPRPAGAIEASF